MDVRGRWECTIGQVMPKVTLRRPKKCPLDFPARGPIVTAVNAVSGDQVCGHLRMVSECRMRERKQRQFGHQFAQVWLWVGSIEWSFGAGLGTMPDCKAGSGACRASVPIVFRLELEGLEVGRRLRPGQRVMGTHTGM